VTVYFVLLFVVTLAIYWSQKANARTTRTVMYAVAFVSMVLVSGLRSGNVGTDTQGYRNVFERTTNFADVWSAGVEPGVSLLSWLAKLMYGDYLVLFILVAVIVTLCFLIGIRRLSVNPVVSVFVLLASGVFYFSFNGMRQGIAIAVLFLAIPFIYYRTFWAFLVCVAVACFFHISAVMFLPVYFIVPRKNDFKYNAFIFGVVVVSVLFFSELVRLAGRLNPRYLVYGEIGQLSHGLAYAASVVAIGLFFLYFKRYVRQHRQWYDFLLNLYLLGVVVTVVAVARTTIVSGVMRMNAYFITSQILLWPMVFANLQGSRHRDLVRFAFVVLFLVYHGILLARFSNLVPYSFNPLVRNGFRLLF
jgi:hypothetical protein